MFKDDVGIVAKYTTMTRSHPNPKGCGLSHHVFVNTQRDELSELCRCDWLFYFLISLYMIFSLILFFAISKANLLIDFDWAESEFSLYSMAFPTFLVRVKTS